MKVIHGYGETVPFRTIDPGEAFMYGTDAFIRLLGRVGTVNAVRIRDGETAFVADDSKVIPKPNAVLKVDGE